MSDHYVKIISVLRLIITPSYMPAHVLLVLRFNPIAHAFSFRVPIFSLLDAVEYVAGTASPCFLFHYMKIG